MYGPFGWCSRRCARVRVRVRVCLCRYLRIDGGVPAALRLQIADRFNADQQIPILLLTTGAGGFVLHRSVLRVLCCCVDGDAQAIDLFAALTLRCRRVAACPHGID